MNLRRVITSEPSCGVPETVVLSLSSKWSGMQVADFLGCKGMRESIMRFLQTLLLDAVKPSAKNVEVHQTYARDWHNTQVCSVALGTALQLNGHLTRVTKHAYNHTWCNTICSCMITSSSVSRHPEHCRSPSSLLHYFFTLWRPKVLNFAGSEAVASQLQAGCTLQAD
jgi:hypothetical protein